MSRRTAPPAPPIPAWLRDEPWRVHDLLRRRAELDPAAWMTWTALHILALHLDTLAAEPDRDLALFPECADLGRFLAAVLPPPRRPVAAVPPDLLDPAADTSALHDALNGAADAFAALLTAAPASDADALLTEASAVVADLLPLLLRWADQVPRLRELVSLLKHLPPRALPDAY